MLVVHVVMNQRQPLFNVVLHAPLVVMWLIIALAVCLLLFFIPTFFCISFVFCFEKLLLNVEWIELQVILHYAVQLLVLVILQVFFFFDKLNIEKCF